MVNAWNGLSSEEKGVSSLAIFKFKFREMTRNELCYCGPKSENIQLTIMRMQCINLNAHLCCRLHVVDDAKYSCGFPKEYTNHFFTRPQYEQRRKTLCRSLDLTTITIQDILFGNDTLSLQINKNNLHVIYQYVRNTGRFEHR